MEYLIIRQVSGKPLVKIHKDKDNNLIRDYLAPEHKEEIEKILSDELKAGITFTSEPMALSDGLNKRDSIRMVARSSNDPLYLEGLMEGINLHPVILVGGFAIDAIVQKEE